MRAGVAVCGGLTRRAATTGSDPHQRVARAPPHHVERLSGQLLPPGCCASLRCLRAQQCVLHVHTATVEVTIEKIVSVLDKKTGEPKKGQTYARKGAAVVVSTVLAAAAAVMLLLLQ